jgi:hypothetical protein
MQANLLALEAGPDAAAPSGSCKAQRRGRPRVQRRGCRRAADGASTRRIQGGSEQIFVQRRWYRWGWAHEARLASRVGNVVRMLVCLFLSAVF